MKQETVLVVDDEPLIRCYVPVDAEQSFHRSLACVLNSGLHVMRRLEAFRSATCTGYALRETASSWIQFRLIGARAFRRYGPCCDDIEHSHTADREYRQQHVPTLPRRRVQRRDEGNQIQNVTPYSAPQAKRLFG